MPTSFINATAEDIGTSEVTVYTAPVGTKSILIGCNLSNKTTSTLSLDLVLRTASGDFYIVKAKRVEAGENEEVMRGNKMVLQAEDSIVATSSFTAGFDVIASVLEGVS